MVSSPRSGRCVPAVKNSHSPAFPSDLGLFPVEHSLPKNYHMRWARPLQTVRSKPPASTLNGVLRCAITHRSLFPGDESQKRSALAVQAARWTAQGIDLIQLREKDLGPLELADIAHAMLDAIDTAKRSAAPLERSESDTEVSSRPERPETELSSRSERSGVERPALLPPSSTRLLINGSLRAAIESHAHGVHLPSNSSILPDEVRRRYAVHSLPRPIVTISCHTLAEIQIARRNHADAILFAPVFGKSIDGNPVTPAAGLEALQAACEAAAPIPIYALGGVTHENAPLCIDAGAAGIAGIRLFHTNLE